MHGHTTNEIRWVHDGGFEGMIFHTYDNISLEGHSPMKVHIRLPPSYNTSDNRYPVIYFQDGEGIFWNAERSWKVTETLRDLEHDRAIREVLAVAICPSDRHKEYTHTFWAKEEGHSGLPHYALFVTALKGWIDERYRTIRDARQTMLVGASHGGLATFYIAATSPQCFGIAVCMSSSFWVGLDFEDRTEEPPPSLRSSLLLKAVASGLRDPRQRPRFWIDWGLERSGGMHNYLIEELATIRGREMVSILQSDFGYTIGLDLWVQERKGHGHDEAAWSIRVREAIQHFFSAR